MKIKNIGIISCHFYNCLIFTNDRLTSRINIFLFIFLGDVDIQMNRKYCWPSWGHYSWRVFILERKKWLRANCCFWTFCTMKSKCNMNMILNISMKLWSINPTVYLKKERKKKKGHWIYYSGLKQKVLHI